MSLPADPTRTSSLLAWAARELDGLEAANPHQDARELLEWAARADSVWRIAEPLDPGVSERFIDAVGRRASRVPLQRITGRMHFRGLSLESAEGVFICRPETEILAGIGVDAAARALEARGQARIVDLCTGSGAIAISMAHEVPGARIWAVELEAAALALARRNIDALTPGRVELVPGDAGDPAVLAELDGTIDLVISNPPYVPASEAPTQAEALLDPPLALYGGGTEGMDVPRRIITRASALLREGGALLVEHSPTQATLMREAAERRGFIGARTVTDLSGAPRALVATRGRIAR